MVIFCDEVQAPSDFSYTTSCRCWHTCAPVWTNFGWLYRHKGGVSTSTTCSVAVIEVHQPKLWSLDFKFAPIRLLYARIFGVLFNTLYVSVTSRTITYILCAIGQCGVLGFPYGTTTSPRTKVLCGGRGYPGIREDNVKCQPPSNWQPLRHGRASPPAARRSPSEDICQPPRA
jgi:hypothetical protein